MVVARNCRHVIGHVVGELHCGGTRTEVTRFESECGAEVERVYTLGQRLDQHIIAVTDRFASAAGRGGINLWRWGVESELRR